MKTRSKFDPGRIAAPLEERFWPKVRKSESQDGCWEWIASRGTWYGKKGQGYGRFLTGSRRDGTNRPCYAHRIAWEMVHGPVPTGMLVLHRCDNPACVRLDHLFLGTHDDNMRDKKEKGRVRITPFKKLNAEQVVEIRKLHAHGAKVSQIAPMYKISKTNIYDIIWRKTWDHVP